MLRYFFKKYSEVLIRYFASITHFCDRHYSLIAWFNIIQICICVAMYAGVTEVGCWSDEYYFFAHARDIGIRYWGDVIWNWSSSPVAHGLAALYSWITTLSHERLIIPYLLLLQSFSFLLGTELWLFKKNYLNNKDKMIAISVVLMVYANLFVARDASEILFWPIGNPPYLLCLASLLGLLWVILWGRGSEFSWLFVVLGFSVVGLNIVGAALMFVFCVMMMATQFVFPTREANKSLYHFIPIMVFAIFILWRTIAGRMGHPTENLGPESHSLRYALYEILSAAPHMLRRLLFSVPIWGCVYLCSPFLLPLEKDRRFALLITLTLFAVALLGGVLLIAFIVPYQFGTPLYMHGRYWSFLSGIVCILMADLGFITGLVSENPKKTFGIKLLLIASLNTWVISKAVKKEIIPTARVMSTYYNVQEYNYRKGYEIGPKLLWRKIDDDTPYLRGVHPIEKGFSGGTFTTHGREKPFQAGTPSGVLHYFGKERLDITQ